MCCSISSLLISLGLLEGAICEVFRSQYRACSRDLLDVNLYHEKIVRYVE